MSSARSWMLYGAAGHTGALIAAHARTRGHQPLLAGRSAPGIAALADRLDLPHRALALDDRLPATRPTGHSGGHEPPPPVAPPPKRGCKPVNRTPSPLPQASAP